MSAQIRQARGAYYDILERTQKGALDITALDITAFDITPWMEWFVGCLGRAIDGVQETLSTVLEKARFWDRIQDVRLKHRQRRVINRLLDQIDGKLTTSKYAALTKCSQDTAQRDILELIECRILVQNPEDGRSISYALAPAQ